MEFVGFGTKVSSTLTPMVSSLLKMPIHPVGLDNPSPAIGDKGLRGYKGRRVAGIDGYSGQIGGEGQSIAPSIAATSA